MRNTDSATLQSPKSGRRFNVLGSVRWIRPARPPTWGCFTAKYAMAKVPVIVIENWIESVTRTPQSPDTDAKKIVTTEQRRRVFHIGHPKRMFPILAAARLTVAMITQLKKRPR